MRKFRTSSPSPRTHHALVVPRRAQPEGDSLARRPSSVRDARRSRLARSRSTLVGRLNACSFRLMHGRSRLRLHALPPRRRARQPPGSRSSRVSNSLKSSCQTDLIRPRRWHHERRPPGLSVLAPLGLVVDRQHPACTLERPQHGRVGRVVAVDAHQHRDLAMTQAGKRSAYSIAAGSTRSRTGAGHGPRGGRPCRSRCCQRR